MKMTALLATVILSFSLIHAEALDPTRALKMKQSAAAQPAASKAASGVKKVTLGEVLSIPKPNPNVEVFQTFFNKDSKTLYLYVNSAGKADFLAITAKKWAPRMKPGLKMGQIFKSSSFFQYDPQNDRILGVSYNNDKGKSTGRYYISQYTAGTEVKYLSTLPTSLNDPKMFRAYNIETCNGNILVNFSGMPHIVDTARKSCMPMMVKAKNPYINDMKLSRNCNTFITPEYDKDAGQAYLSFEKYPLSQAEPTKIKVLGKGESVFRIAREKNDAYYAVSNRGMHLQVLDKRGKVVLDKMMKAQACSGSKANDLIFQTKFSPNSEYLGVAQICGVFSLIHLKSGEIVNETLTNAGLADFDFSPDGVAIALSAGLSDGKMLAVMTANPESTPAF